MSVGYPNREEGEREFFALKQHEKKNVDVDWRNESFFDCFNIVDWVSRF